MERYRKPGMEYRFHDDLGEPAHMSGGEATDPSPASGNGDEAGAAADGMGPGDPGGVAPM